MPANCMVRTKTAIIEGSKAFLASTLTDPGNFAFLTADGNGG